uniref:Uncharacterized protein n=1 Tax=viral metagenome TaxID=1070528 RepID=A0A6C0JFX0_9ZZZZ
MPLSFTKQHYMWILMILTICFIFFYGTHVIDCIKWVSRLSIFTIDNKQEGLEILAKNSRVISEEPSHSGINDNLLFNKQEEIKAESKQPGIIYTGTFTTTTARL